MPCALGYLWFCLIISLMSPARTLGIVTTLSAVFLCRNYAATFLPEFPLNGHFWSLSIEEQFYLVWPLLLILTGLRRAPWIAIAGTLAFASYRFAHWSSLARLPLGKTFGTEFHADALLIGCTMALFLPTARRYLRSWMALPLVTGLLLCMMHYRGLIPLQESLVIALLLAVTSSCACPVFCALDWKPLTFLGTISYSLYVWQQPFAMVAHNSLSAFFLAALMLPVVAIGSYYLLEKPFMTPRVTVGVEVAYSHASQSCGRDDGIVIAESTCRKDRRIGQENSRCTGTIPLRDQSGEDETEPVVAPAAALPRGKGRLRSSFMMSYSHPCKPKPIGGAEPHGHERQNRSQRQAVSSRQ
jgi:peptidoglycan/LPS O-acetylase OafA/YrhL